MISSRQGSYIDGDQGCSSGCFRASRTRRTYTAFMSSKVRGALEELHKATLRLKREAADVRRRSDSSARREADDHPGRGSFCSSTASLQPQRCLFLLHILRLHYRHHQLWRQYYWSQHGSLDILLVLCTRVDSMVILLGSIQRNRRKTHSQ